MKRFTIFLIFLIIFSIPISASNVCFQDNTFLNNLRVCNTSGSCFILQNSNCTEITNIAYCHEIDSKTGRLGNVDIYDVSISNSKMIILLIVLFLIFIICLTVILQSRKKK